MTDCLLSEATMGDLREMMRERFGTFIFYGDNHDPSLGQEGDVITAIGGPSWKREGLMSIINEDFLDETLLFEEDDS